ncbi:hypothetical protein E2C01_096318 [Portunus trituberculatus]|uniref:Uncharacterized protein n=1 Tax=Portunus trituberculatus TaxID=210409 RepID=A0A5B7K687_PORTR|nr:hypothetical protein [Portunus trituberculatus]
MSSIVKGRIYLNNSDLTTILLHCLQEADGEENSHLWMRVTFEAVREGGGGGVSPKVSRS